MVAWQFILIYMLGGALAGLSAGLLGIGGGLIVVPFLSIVLGYAGFPQDELMHVAVATSLLLIVFTSTSSMIAHIRKGEVIWRAFWSLLPGLIIGAIIGANIADLLPSSVLRIVFGTFVFIIAYTMIKQRHSENLTMRPLPVGYFLSGAGVIIGVLCNILGMGGGGLIVPFLSHYNVRIRQAIATSAVCGFPTALTGVIALVLVGLDESANRIPGTTGYLYWTAFFSMIIPSMLCAQWGAYLAHRLPGDKLRKIFAVFLIIVGVDMLRRAAESLFINLF